MQLLTHLLTRIVLVAGLCLAAATGFLLVDTHRGMEAATRASADRVVTAMRALYWQDLLWRDGLERLALMPLPDWQTLETASLIAPGVCLTFEAHTETPRRLCNTATGVLPPAPGWFVTFDQKLFGGFPTIHRSLDARKHPAGEISLAVDLDAAIALVWARIVSMCWLAASITAALVVAIGLVVVRTLRPVQGITERLRLMQAADYAPMAGGRAPFELGRISEAVDALAARLARTEAVRAALTRRLFQVQEEERRALARDLHDEFGQCLFAVGACAASIEAGAADRPDLAADARAVSGLARRMRGTLQEALVRLRSQDVDELGLEAALRGMILRADGQARAAVSLDVSGDLASVPRPIAIDLFRIAQECLTNAARHAAPSRVRLAVVAGEGSVSLDVEDDGGGEPDTLAAGTGHGLAGIRERIAALGGDLVIARARAGIRIAATIPFLRPDGARAALVPS